MAKTKKITEELTKEDLATAKSKIKEFIKGSGKLLSGFGASSVLSVMAGIADKLCRDEEGKFKPGWFYSYLTSNLISGASSEILNNYLCQRQVELDNNVVEKLHEMFDGFSIDERRARCECIDKSMEDVHCMKKAVNGYLGATSTLLSCSISSVALITTTFISGGLANLPIMGGVVAASAINAYILGRRMNEEKVARKNQIRKANAQFRAVDRQAYITSYQMETADSIGKSKQIFSQKRKKREEEYELYTKMLNKYALIGTLIKSVVIAGVVAATIAHPANALVMVAASLGTYSAVSRCISAHFSRLSHIGNFAHAFKSFKPKLKVKYGKEKIDEKANVIELENVAVYRKNPKDSTKFNKDILFFIPDKQRIGPGITLLSGASGAGKSTLINLLMHSNDVNAGTIKIGTVDKHGIFNGKEYSDLAFAEPSRHIALSMQRSEFMEMTVNEYIRLSNPNASEELVQEVMDLVGIKDDPNNPEMISPQKIIDGNGGGLSGGQANRISLAQALIKDAPILILDEPTAGVDATMEENISQYLNELKKRKTIIYITHNAEDVRDLEIDQALDLSRDGEGKPAVMTRYDLSDEKVKKAFLEYFVDRNIGLSPTPDISKLENLRTTLSRQMAEQREEINKPNNPDELSSDTSHPGIKKRLKRFEDRLKRFKIILYKMNFQKLRSGIKDKLLKTPPSKEHEL